MMFPVCDFQSKHFCRIIHHNTLEYILGSGRLQYLHSTQVRYHWEETLLDNEYFCHYITPLGEQSSPGYDFGRREFLHAASAARLYIISLKYWPQVQSLNIWQTQPFLDINFAPLLLCKAVNTLGNEMGNVKFHSDVRLPDDIRAYIFTSGDSQENANDAALALIWTSNRDVENGFQPNPVIGVTFDQPVRFIDLMGCERTAVPDEHGMIQIPVTPAPLLIKATDAEKLSQSLGNAKP